MKPLSKALRLFSTTLSIEPVQKKCFEAFYGNSTVVVVDDFNCESVQCEYSTRTSLNLVILSPTVKYSI